MRVRDLRAQHPKKIQCVYKKMSQIGKTAVHDSDQYHQIALVLKKTLCDSSSPAMYCLMFSADMCE